MGRFRLKMHTAPFLVTDQIHNKKQLTGGKGDIVLDGREVMATGKNVWLHISLAKKQRMDRK